MFSVIHRISFTLIVSYTVKSRIQALGLYYFKATFRGAYNRRGVGREGAFIRTYTRDVKGVAYLEGRIFGRGILYTGGVLMGFYGI